MLERNRVVGQRIARVMSAASGLSEVACSDDPEELAAAMADDPLLLGCDAADLPLALDWAGDRFPGMSLVVWTSGEIAPVLEAARRHRIPSVIGWPSFASMPRPWEIAVAVRRITNPGAAPPRVADILGWGAAVLKWRPRTSQDRDRAVAEVEHWAERAGAPPRMAEKLCELSHELLMNAMYDAPAADDGRPRYAHDRRSQIVLDDAELPTFRLGTDGELIAIQVVDPFGRLRKHHVFDGILRGLGAKSGSGKMPVLDTSGGGAGLGMLKIYTAGMAMLVDVERGASTQVMSVLDLNVNPREQRGIPISLHFFEHREARFEGEVEFRTGAGGGEP